MGVFIKGMKMPKNCRVCEISVDCDACEGRKWYCPLVGELDYTDEMPKDRRHENCPLIEIETPHGRLIDEKKINNVTWTTEDGTETDAPTVIDAEE